MGIDALTQAECGAMGNESIGQILGNPRGQRQDDVEERKEMGEGDVLAAQRGVMYKQQVLQDVI